MTKAQSYDCDALIVGAGMIGSNIVKALNEKGINDILVVDNLKNGKKFQNLVNN